MTSSVSASDITKGRKLTPMLQQYVDAKAEVPADAILMFRMGDFYEMFFDDARVAARELDIVLTSRDKNGGADAIPMAGVPHHAVGSYLSRLIEKGYSVALCDQIEDPKKAKGIVKRAIVRVVTPGTVADLDSLDPVNANYLAYAERVGDYWVVALMDLLAGEVLLTRAQGATLGDELRRMSVREVLCEGSTQNTLEKELGERPISLRTVDGEAPGDKKAREFLLQRFGTDQIEGLTESEASAERSALQRLLSFADNTQRRSLTHLMAPRVYHLNDHLILDEATRRNLELVQTQLNSERKGSLLWHLDRCKTAMGSRTLAQWLLFPLRDKRAISERLDAVEDLRLHRAKREAAQAALVGVRDIERLLGKVALERATPKDLALLRASLREIPKLKEELAKGETHLALAWLKIDPAREILALLEKALVEEPPLSAADGGIFNLGYDSELDEYIHLSTEGHDFLADLERRERVRTKIPTLKVRFNRVFGYYLEVSRAHSNNVPPDYIRKQTLVNAERFITDELKSYEDRVLGADERRKAKEAELFALLVKTIGESSSLLRNIGRLIARSDILAALAQVADEYNYCRPLLVDEPMISIRAGRHAVLERLMPGGERFVPNDIDLDTQTRQLMIITGPNMAGKSTVMRQGALIAILAHMGSFVPAEKAQIGLTDRVFTRVGASDNLGRGQSTFMVEMQEAATILEHATSSSLVLLDEIGRGTSTFDGVSIAWAVAEHLHDEVGCRTVFATHYHELTDLAEGRERIVNGTVAIKEKDGRIVFLRRLIDGATNRSYGIHVAEMAGLPDSVVQRAKQILHNLESGEQSEEQLPLSPKIKIPGSHRSIGRSTKVSNSKESEPQPRNQLGLFGASEASSEKKLKNEEALVKIEEALAGMDPMNMTPINALQELDRLKKMLAAGAKSH